MLVEDSSKNGKAFVAENAEDTQITQKKRKKLLPVKIIIGAGSTNLWLKPQIHIPEPAQPLER